jgi:hypothetical protein
MADYITQRFCMFLEQDAEFVRIRTSTPLIRHKNLLCCPTINTTLLSATKILLCIKNEKFHGLRKEQATV